MARKEKQSVYEIVTNKIVEALEKGVIPWQKPWNGRQHAPRSASTGKPYRGVNAFLLALQANAMGYDSPYWLTYKQAQSLGGNVRKGEKSTLVVFYKTWETKDKDTGEDVKIPVLRYFNVFHASQCDGLPEKFYVVPDADGHEFTPIQNCENVVAGYADPPAIEHGGTSAFYKPSADTVRMPVAEKFQNSEAYYTTLFHELAHSTGHCSRLDRKGIANVAAFGSESHGREELIAEMGAAFLCGHCGIESTMQNSASYVQGWLKAIKQDSRLVVQSAGAAQKAADWILGSE